MRYFIRRHHIFLVAILATTTGCLMTHKQEDLAHYINQDILFIGQIESVALQRYAAVTGANYTSAQSVYDALDTEVIPVYERFYSLLTAIQPEDPEVAKAHAYYVRGSKEAVDGFKLKRYGISENKDYLISMGNTKIREGLAQTMAWKAEIERLMVSRDLATKAQSKSKFMETFENMVESIMDAHI